jgi:predicted nucleotide-binding protein
MATEIMARQVSNIKELRDLEDDFHIWDDFNYAYICQAFTTNEVADNNYRTTFSSIGGTIGQMKFSVHSHVRTQRQRLMSIRETLPLRQEAQELDNAPLDVETATHGDGIFVVHGHDGEIKLQVVDYIQKCVGITPIVLHAQPDMGRTIIEKFEDHASEARFAIVLFTADDLGKALSEHDFKPRARQNVVLEFSFLLRS